MEVVAVVVAALLVGNEFATWAVVHRQLARLPVPQHIVAGQALHRAYGVMIVDPHGRHAARRGHRRRRRS